MLTTLDYSIIVIYLIAVAGFGIKAGGKQTSTDDYFLGGRNLPWWAVSFSIVATETSTLTVIGLPAVTYFGSLVFMQVTGGYMIGRIVVSFWFLPKYFAGELSTAYAFLGERFGMKMRQSASLTFILTRLLADGVRLFATAIPLRIIAIQAGFDFSYTEIIIAIGFLTIIYTYIGGIKAVVWMDVVQMLVYIGGGLAALFILNSAAPENWWALATEAGKTQLINTGFDSASFSDWITQPYTTIAAVFGGAVFAMASHGTDHLIVQRILTCRDLKDGQKALITSGFLVALQFALFLGIGLLLWQYYGGQPLADLGLLRGDEVFPKFIIEGLPAGLSGLLLAGIIAAAMSTLSSSLNALASATVFDFPGLFKKQITNEESRLKIARYATLFWGIVFMFFATLFEGRDNPVVELGLAIASFTYGGLLGAFLLGLLNRRPNEKDALISFGLTLICMILIIFGLWFTNDGNWIFDFMPSDLAKSEQGLRGLGWLWFTVLGSAMSVIFGSILALRHPKQ